MEIPTQKKASPCRTTDLIDPCGGAYYRLRPQTEIETRREEMTHAGSEIRADDQGVRDL
jgi:hypothetical protein